MKKIKLIMLLLLTIGIYGQSKAQDTEMSKSFGIIVFPAEDQDKSRQEFDEFKCYKWAVNYGGYDPLSPPEKKVSGEQLAGDGSTIKGAAGGAIFGALIGAVAGNAKKGAKIGAVAGGLSGAAGKAARDEEIRKALEEQERKNKEGLIKFKKSFCTCMDAKGYKATF